MNIKPINWPLCLSNYAFPLANGELK